MIFYAIKKQLQNMEKNIKYVCKSYHESFFKQDEKWVRYPAWDISNNFSTIIIFVLLALKNIK